MANVGGTPAPTRSTKHSRAGITTTVEGEAEPKSVGPSAVSPLVGRLEEPEIREAETSRGPTALNSLAAAARSLRPVARVVVERRWARWLGVGVLLGVALFVALGRERAEPFIISGSARIKLTESGDMVRWHDQQVTLTIDPSFDDLGVQAYEAVLQGVDAWSDRDQHTPKLNFEMASERRKVQKDGINLVKYGEIDVPGYRDALGITIGYWLPSTGKIVEADTIINSRHHLALLEASDGSSESHSHENGCHGSFDLQSIAAHEAGHILGLGEDETEPEATMYYKTQRCSTKKRDLFDTDVVAITTVYQDAELASAGDTHAAACALGRDDSKSWASGLAFLLAGGLVRRRRRRPRLDRVRLLARG